MKPLFSLDKLTVVCAISLAFTSVQGAIVSFQGIGTESSNPANPSASWATDVSDDGQYVAGYWRTKVDSMPIWQGFRLSRDGTRDLLGEPDARCCTSFNAPVANTISGDGMIAAGEIRGVGELSLPEYSSRIAAWEFGVGGFSPRSLPPELPFPTYRAKVSLQGASATGDVLVGSFRYAAELSTTAVRVTSAGIVRLFPYNDHPSVDSKARAVSSDGSKIVGFGPAGNGQLLASAFLWTAESGMSVLPDLPGGASESSAFGISDNGSVIVGWGTSAAGKEPTRWVNGVPLTLGHLPDSTSGEARDLSADGSIVIGTDGLSAFYWSSSTGMVKMADYLSTLGVTMDGWTLDDATAISKDGTTIVGNGMHNGVQEGWIATIPEPASVALLLCSSLLISRRQRKG